MIKQFYYLLIITGIALGCNNTSAPQVKNETAEAAEKKSFFRVSTYIKGQLYDVKQLGITPIKYITTNDKTDSAMLPLSEIDAYAKEFLQPEIDSTNLTDSYTESKFLDRTINAFTFTYEPVNPSNDSLPLQHWDVYVEPETGKVKRIYIVKKMGDKILQLTWLHNQWFKTTTIVTKPDGSTAIEKEEKISWSY